MKRHVSSSGQEAAARVKHAQEVTAAAAISNSLVEYEVFDLFQEVIIVVVFIVVLVIIIL